MDGSSGYIVEEEIECTEDWVDTNCTADTITTHINDVDDVGVQSLRNKQADDGEIKLAMILGAVLFILMCVIGCAYVNLRQRVALRRMRRRSTMILSSAHIEP